MWSIYNLNVTTEVRLKEVLQPTYVTLQGRSLAAHACWREVVKSYIETSGIDLLREGKALRWGGVFPSYAQHG
jgi:hypothetical protein